MCVGCKVAIAIYDRTSDFLDLYAKCEQLIPKAKAYLRHYTQGWSETIIFFVPTEDRRYT